MGPINFQAGMLMPVIGSMLQKGRNLSFQNNGQIWQTAKRSLGALAKFHGHGKSKISTVLPRDGSTCLRLSDSRLPKRVAKETALSLVPISPALGAEVRGVDLSRPLDQKTQGVMQKGLDDFCALIFRNQNINGPQMVQSLNFLGNVVVEQHFVDQGLTLKGCPECFVLRNDEKNPPLFDFWHTDKASWKVPVTYSVLLCKEIPKMGGGTLIANTRKAFDEMSQGMKELFREMTGVYNEKNGFVKNPKITAYLKNKGFNSAGVYDHFQDQEHPVVKKNPRNGIEALYFSPPYFSRMKGFSEEESRYFQDVLVRSITKPEFVYRHSWKVGDLLIFDNRCTSHYAAADFYPQPREMHRIIITEQNKEDLK